MERAQQSAATAQKQQLIREQDMLMRQTQRNQQMEYRAVLNDQKANKIQDPLVKLNRPGAGYVMGSPNPNSAAHFEPGPPAKATYHCVRPKK